MCKEAISIFLERSGHARRCPAQPELCETCGRLTDQHAERCPSKDAEVRRMVAGQMAQGVFADGERVRRRA